MRDNELFAFFKPIIDAGLTANNISAVMTQSFQPTLEGIQPLITVFMQKITSHRYGFVHKYDLWNADTGVFDHYEVQQMETVFQVGCLSLQDVQDPEQLTANDILDTVCATLQSDSTLLLLKAQGMGIERVTDIRNPFFKADKGQWQASPSFDFTVTHKQSTISTTPKVDTFEANIYPV